MKKLITIILCAAFICTTSIPTGLSYLKRPKAAMLSAPSLLETGGSINNAKESLSSNTTTEPVINKSRITKDQKTKSLPSLNIRTLIKKSIWSSYKYIIEPGIFVFLCTIFMPFSFIPALSLTEFALFYLILGGTEIYVSGLIRGTITDIYKTIKAEWQEIRQEEKQKYQQAIQKGPKATRRQFIKIVPIAGIALYLSIRSIPRKIINTFLQEHGTPTQQMILEHTAVTTGIVDAALLKIKSKMGKLPRKLANILSAVPDLFQPASYHALKGSIRKNLGLSGKVELWTEHRNWQAAEKAGLIIGKDIVSLHYTFDTARDMMDMKDIFSRIKKLHLSEPITMVVHPLEWDLYIDSLMKDKNLSPESSKDARKSIQSELMRMAESAKVRIAFEITLTESISMFFDNVPNDIQKNIPKQIQGPLAGTFYVDNNHLYYQMNACIENWYRSLQMTKELIKRSSLGKSTQQRLISEAKKIQTDSIKNSQELEAFFNQYLPKMSQIEGEKWDYKGKKSVYLKENILEENQYEAYAIEYINKKRAEAGMPALTKAEKTQIKQTIQKTRHTEKEKFKKLKSFFKDVYVTNKVNPAFFTCLYPNITFDLGQYQKGRTQYVDRLIDSMIDRIKQLHNANPNYAGFTLDFWHIVDRLHHNDFFNFITQIEQAKTQKKKQKLIQDLKKSIRGWLEHVIKQLQRKELFEIHLGELPKDAFERDITKKYHGPRLRRAYLNESFFEVMDFFAGWIHKIQELDPSLDEEQACKIFLEGGKTPNKAYDAGQPIHLTIEADILGQLEDSLIADIVSSVGPLAVVGGATAIAYKTLQKRLKSQTQCQSAA